MKIQKEKKTPMESLKVHSHKVKLMAKRDEVNYVEDIVDRTRERSIPTTWNPAVVYLNPTAGMFLEEGILQDNLRKIQGLK